MFEVSVYKSKTVDRRDFLNHLQNYRPVLPALIQGFLPAVAFPLHSYQSNFLFGLEQFLYFLYRRDYSAAGNSLTNLNRVFPFSVKKWKTNNWIALATEILINKILVQRNKLPFQAYRSWQDGLTSLSLSPGEEATNSYLQAIAAGLNKALLAPGLARETLVSCYEELFPKRVKINLRSGTLRWQLERRKPTPRILGNLVKQPNFDFNQEAGSHNYSISKGKDEPILFSQAQAHGFSSPLDCLSYYCKGNQQLVTLLSQLCSQNAALLLFTYLSLRPSSKKNLTLVSDDAAGKENALTIHIYCKYTSFKVTYRYCRVICGLKTVNQSSAEGVSLPLKQEKSLFNFSGELTVPGTTWKKAGELGSALIINRLLLKIKGKLVMDQMLFNLQLPEES